MNDRLHFAALLLAANLGVMPRKQFIAAADAQIAEADKPEAWLIELSTQGDSSELNQLAQREFKQVSFEVLRLAYQAWCENKISAPQFHHCCKELLQAGAHEHEFLSRVDDQFDLATSGILDSREARRNARVTLEQAFQRLPRDWAESTDTLELLTFTSPIYRENFILILLNFPVPKRDEFRDWWKRRGPAIIVRADGHKTKVVVEFEVGLLQLKGIRDRENCKPEDARSLLACLPDVTAAEAPIGSKLLVTSGLWNLILG